MRPDRLKTLVRSEHRASGQFGLNLAARFLAEEIGLSLRKAQLLQFWRIFLLLG